MSEYASCDGEEVSQRQVNDSADGVHGVDEPSTTWLKRIQETMTTLLRELQDVAHLEPRDLLVVGASSSEVMGRRIGTATSVEVGRAVVESVFRFADELGIHVAVQCCEHLNRSLVVEASVAEHFGLTRVHAVPVPGAGGAVASAAYFSLQQPALVAAVHADAGIDIGDTLIGMHLKPVAVPVRGSVREVGQAHVTMATSRPPLIGGSRAVYDVKEAKRRLGLTESVIK